MTGAPALPFRMALAAAVRAAWPPMAGAPGTGGAL